MRSRWFVETDSTRCLAAQINLDLAPSRAPCPQRWRSAVRLVGNRLLFVATDEVRGFELWKAKLDAPS